MRFRFGRGNSSVVVVGLFFVPSGLALWLLSGYRSPPRFDQLQHLEGTVLSARLRKPHQSGSYYQFELDFRGNGLTVQLPDLSYSDPSLVTIAPGQWVEFWADPSGGVLGPTVYWAWQIVRAPDMILSYEERVRSYEASHRRTGSLAIGMIVSGIAFAALATLHAGITGREKVATGS